MSNPPSDWDDYAVRAARRWAFEDALSYHPRLDGIGLRQPSAIPSHLRAAIARGEPVSATVDGDQITYSEATD